MSKRIQLEIAEPCHENWDKMSKSERGRFCGSCQKQVIDFTTMSDREIALFFKKPSTGSVCGRFMGDQLNRDMEIPKKRIPWVKYFFQFTLPAFLVSMKATAQGKIKVKEKINAGTVMIPANPLTPLEKKSLADMVPTIKAVLPEPVNCTENVIPLLSGRVGMTTVVEPKHNLLVMIIDENDQPVPYASVVVNATNGKMITGNTAGENGTTKLYPGKKWKEAELVVTSVGFEKKRMTIKQTELSQGKLVIRLQAKAALSEVVVVTTGWMGLIKRVDVMGSVTKGIPVDRSSVKVPNVPLMKSEPVVQVLRVYPNPVLAGNTINIACEKLDEGYYSFQLLNLSGQMIHQREVWVDDKATVLNFELPRAAAGSYVLRMIHKQSGKSFTEKVILE